MTSNLHEFMGIAGLVTMSTTAVIAFRYAIIVFERRGLEEIRRRQPEWNAIAARARRGEENNPT